MILKFENVTPAQWQKVANLIEKLAKTLMSDDLGEKEVLEILSINKQKDSYYLLSLTIKIDETYQVRSQIAYEHALEEAKQEGKKLSKDDWEKQTGRVFEEEFQGYKTPRWVVTEIYDALEIFPEMKR